MEIETYLRFAAALIFVLALIGVLAWLARRFGFGGAVPARSGRDRRLEILETRAVDSKRRLLLLRRDNREHLVLIGPNADLVIETGIEADMEAGTGSAPFADDAPTGRTAAPADGPAEPRERTAAASDSQETETREGARPPLKRPAAPRARRRRPPGSK